MNDHYFAAEPTSQLRRVPVSARVWGRQLDLVSASGVFSSGRLDLGTSVLFRSVGPPEEGETFLDLGCGYGVIACALALARPEATVWGVDVNERALQLSAENAERVGAPDRVRLSRPEGVPADVVFDQIWSNPPIRIGKSALHDLLQQWLPRLAPGGTVHLVVGRNLGADSLQRWLHEQGYVCERTASAKGFRVLRVQR
jgi:16S rRNA (guanine1207-N2)-methyltransferase